MKELILKKKQEKQGMISDWKKSLNQNKDE